ncbi:MAG: YchJ family protein [Rhizobium sp.]|nr:YchJ family protein [Rhizobium sp.]
MNPCPCGSAKSSGACCDPILAGQPAPTAEALMRSRYCAYVAGNADHLQRTSAGEALLNFDRDDVRRSFAGTEWLGLEVLDTSGGGEGDAEGTVTFRARFRRDGRFHVLSERSEFRQIGGEWRYCRGDVAPDAGGCAAGQVGRNDPCPCGSGRKFKKCHGA